VHPGTDAPAAGGRNPDDLAFDLHDGPGQLFLAIHLLAESSLDGLVSETRLASLFTRLAELAMQGKWETDQIARGLLSLPQAGGDLPRALRRLGRSFQADSGIVTLIRTSGSPGRLGHDQAVGLYRVAHLAFMNAWRHARARLVCVQLRLDPASASLEVKDDGVGLGQRWNHRGTRMGISSMRRTMAELGGSCRLRSLSPRGVSVQADIPLEDG
jgi:signal transduction histidine kinase